MKPINLTKVENPLEVNRKMVFETIASKIQTHNSNPSLATVNDDDIMLAHSIETDNNNAQYKLHDDP